MIVRSDARVDDTGFSIVEMMMVVAIIGILVTIAIPSYRMARERAIEGTLEANAAIVATALQIRAHEGYDTQYKNFRNPRPDRFLSHRLWEDLEATGVEAVVKDPIVNPVSGFDNVVVRFNIYAEPSRNRPPAVWVTGGRRNNEFERITPNPDDLGGTIIVCFNQTSDSVDVFYVNSKGELPEEPIRLTLED